MIIPFFCKYDIFLQFQISRAQSQLLQYRDKYRCVIWNRNTSSTQPKTPQTCCKLSILPTCCNLSTSCNKFVNFIKLQQVCWNQPCYNLSFADLVQLVETSCKKPVEIINLQQVCWNLATSLLTTCNRLVVISSRKPCVVRTHPDIGLL